MTTPDCYIVRFKGHVCASVPTGLSRKPLLLRARKGEAVFVEKILVGHEPEVEDIGHVCVNGDKIARVACARAIKRTDAVRLKLRAAGDNHMLRGVQSVERLLRDPVKRSRRGKRWKICPARSEDLTPTAAQKRSQSTHEKS